MTTTDLRKVGDEMSGYLDPCCLSPAGPEPPGGGGLDLGEVDSAALSGSDTTTLSRSTEMGLERPELTLEGSLSLEEAGGGAEEGGGLAAPHVSMLLDRCPPLPPTLPTLDLAGRGRLRY